MKKRKLLLLFCPGICAITEDKKLGITWNNYVVNTTFTLNNDIMCMLFQYLNQINFVNYS